MSQTLIEKVAQRYAVGHHPGHRVRAGDFLSIQPAHCMTHDNTAAVIPKFRSMGATRIANPRQPVFCLDHDIQNTAPENLATYATIEAFAREQGIDFYPAGRGIGHQVLIEEGYVLPGTLVVASDSHANMYGAIGALGTPIVRTDAAAIWATGRTWWQVPEIVQVYLEGRLGPGVTGKDVIITLIGLYCRDEVLNACIEFAGPGVAALAMEERMTIANMTTEWGALAGVFPCDEVTLAYLRTRVEVLEQCSPRPQRLAPQVLTELAATPLCADPDAHYAKVLALDLALVRPRVAGPNEVKSTRSVAELAAERIRVDKAFLMSCVNGRTDDFAAAAAELRGRQVAPHVQLFVAAASSEVEQEARRRGDWQVLAEAGAKFLPAGCGACIGLGAGVLTDGEVGISATNRNFDGRMGSRKSQVYLASPAVVAASAAAGYIAAPQWAGNSVSTSDELTPRICSVPRPAQPAQRVELLAGFPGVIRGELLWLPKDNLNTDGIYGKEFTYKTLPPEEMAAVVMRNYDPEFQELAQAGDLLVGGYNFGCGSSREQAATALKFRGIGLVLAGSFSQTFSRNAFNNGFICLECPALVDSLRQAFGVRNERTLRTGWQATVDFGASAVSVVTATGAQVFRYPPLGIVAQELIVAGGFEAVLRRTLS